MLEMRTSERKSLRSCAQQWAWSTVEGLRPKREPVPFWFGTAVHESLAAWYIPGTQRGPHPAETFDTLLEGERLTLIFDDESEAKYVDSRAMGIDMLTHYVEVYGDEPNKEYIAPEFKGAVILNRPAVTLFGKHYPVQKRWMRYHFTYDGVYRDLATGEIWLDEHKTAASIWGDFLPLDDQAGSYYALAQARLERAGILKPGEEIAGIMYNFLRKALRDTRDFTMVEGTKMFTNKPLKQHYIDALYNHFGEDSPSEEMKAWEEDLPKMKLDELAELAAVQGLEVRGEVSKSQPPAYFERIPVYRSRSERATMINRIKQDGIIAEAYREGWLPIIKNPTMMNCRMCHYRQLCELHEVGDMESVEEFKEARYVKGDAYEAYREIEIS